jgi:hypothetical protein
MRQEGKRDVPQHKAAQCVKVSSTMGLCGLKVTYALSRSHLARRLVKGGMTETKRGACQNGPALIH